MSSDSKRRFGRRQFLKVAGTGAASAALAGCTGGTDGDGGASPTPSPTDAGDGGDQTTETETPTPGDTFNEMVYLAPDALTSIDPAKMGGAPDYTSVINLYDSLIWVEGGTYRPISNIATDWRTENEGTTWIFSLRDDATHHSGNQLTADDVVYSIDRLLELNKSPASFFAGIYQPGNARARDDTTVAIDIDFPYGPFVSILVQLFIVDSEVAQSEGSGDNAQEYLAKNPAGSGPYQLKRREEGSQIIFEAFDDYWGGWANNQFDEARMKIVGEDSTVKILMKNGEADLTSKFLAASTYDELATFDNVEVPTVAQLFLWHMPMHTQKPPLDDVHVRKAIVHTMDYQAVVEQVFKGGSIAAGPVPIGMPGHNDDLEPYQRDLDLAKSELDKASYSLEEINDIQMEIMYTSVLPFERPISLLLQNGMKELGITSVKIQDTPWPTMLERTSQKDTTPHFTQVGNTAKVPTPDGHTYDMYHPSAFGQINAASWYTTDELKALLEDARSTVEQEARLEKYKEAQRLIYDGYPSVFMANPAYRAGINKNLGGWQYRGLLSYDHRFYDMHRKGSGRA